MCSEWGESSTQWQLFSLGSGGSRYDHQALRRTTRGRQGIYNTDGQGEGVSRSWSEREEWHETKNMVNGWVFWFPESSQARTSQIHPSHLILRRLFRRPLVSFKATAAHLEWLPLHPPTPTSARSPPFCMYTLVS